MKFIKNILKANEKNYLAGTFFLMLICLPFVAFADKAQGEFPPVTFEQEFKDNTRSKGGSSTTAIPSVSAARSGNSRQKKQQLTRIPSYPQAQIPRYYLPRRAQAPGYPLPAYAPGRPVPGFAPYAPRPPITPRQRPMLPYQPYPGRRYAPYGGYAMPQRPMAYPAPTYTYPRAPAYTNRFTPNPNKQLPPPVHNISPPSQLNITGKPVYPMRKKIKREKHAWGDERNIWSDFYTDFTEDFWDSMINAPSDVGRMPGGWRAPSFTSPDPVTIGDAVTNQLPPMFEEMGNMSDFSN